MASTVQSAAESIPAHVPRDLVRSYNLSIWGDVVEDPLGFWRRVRSEAPDLFYVGPYDNSPGHWVVQGAGLVREVFQTPELFSSASTGAAGGARIWPRRLVPLELDPPEHAKYRALLSRYFSPMTIDRLENHILKLAGGFVEKFAARGECDFMAEFARPFPVTIVMELLGLPLEERPQFSAWEHEMFQGETIDKRRVAGVAVAQYLSDLIRRKREKPADDVISYLIGCEVDGAPIGQEPLEDICFLLYIAGLDTVTGALGHIFRWLAEHPEAQAELRANPAKIPDANEELLRYHSWISTVRTVTRDTPFHGVQLHAGDTMFILTNRGSNDPRETPHPDTVDFHRESNPHFAFGGGVHRCLGSHLARRELRVAVAQMFERVPPFRIRPGAKLRYDGGLVCLSSLPLVWDRA
ncbi:MAG: cytochrome P450 [Gammaproteobacteria bacterium]